MGEPLLQRAHPGEAVFLPYGKGIPLEPASEEMEGSGRENDPKIHAVWVSQPRVRSGSGITGSLDESLGKETGKTGIQHPSRSSGKALPLDPMVAGRAPCPIPGSSDTSISSWHHPDVFPDPEGPPGLALALNPGDGKGEMGQLGFPIGFPLELLPGTLRDPMGAIPDASWC